MGSEQCVKCGEIGAKLHCLNGQFVRWCQKCYDEYWLWPVGVSS